MDELKAISTFVQVVEAGSFHRAALAQGLSPQAVSKSVRQLEQHLGVRLLHRTTRKNSPTPEGQQLFDSVRSNLEGLHEALQAVRSSAKDDEGTIRISAGSSVARKVLVPLLARFAEAHPAIQFDLLLEDRLTDAVGERIDVGFRAGNAPSSQVIARRLFPIQLIVCASPAYLRSHAAPSQPGDLSGHRCVTYRQPSTGRIFPWEFSAGGEVQYQPVRGAVSCSDPEAEMQATVAGMGLGQIDSINATAAIRAGLLVPLLVDYVSERMGLYLYFAQRSQMPRRVRKFIDFAVAELKAGDAFHIPPAELKAISRRAGFSSGGCD